MLFILPSNLFSFSRYLNFCVDILVIKKNALIRKISLWCHNPGHKQLEYTYCPVSQEVKAIRQHKMRHNIIRQTFFLKNQTQNVLENLFPDPFQKIQNWACLTSNSLTFYTVCFYCMPSWWLSKYVEAMLQNTCFYHI